MQYPTVTRSYFNHHLDSSRWEVYQPRVDDVIVTTSYKCGTTFTQQILYNLLVENTLEMDEFPVLTEASPWVDARFSLVPRSELGDYLEALPGRRFLKSHLPLDGLPYFPQVKYIVVGRDPRDVFMSLLNHYGAYTDSFYKRLNDGVEDPMPRFVDDVRTLWRGWISRGWFEWEREGYPFWGNMSHTQSYWDCAELPNIMFLHYSDMLADLPGAVQEIADFIGHELTPDVRESVVEAVSFKRVKEQAVVSSSKPSDIPQAFEGGAATFINQGTNGRWRGVLTDEDVVLYEKTRDQVLSPDCAAWLEGGKSAIVS